MTRGVVRVPAPRNEVMAFKCSKNERDDIRREAKDRGMSVSEYIRHAHELMSSHEERAREILVAMERIKNRKKRASK